MSEVKRALLQHFCTLLRSLGGQTPLLGVASVLGTVVGVISAKVAMWCKGKGQKMASVNSYSKRC